MSVFPDLLLTVLFIFPRFSSGAGHYTQVVWADTEELGCGMVHYQVRREELLVIIIIIIITITIIIIYYPAGRELLRDSDRV